MGTQPSSGRSVALVAGVVAVVAALLTAPPSWAQVAPAQTSGRTVPYFMAKAPPPPPPPGGSQWLMIGLGFTPVSNLFIGDPEADADTFVEGGGNGELPLLEAEGADPSFGFTVGAHHRFRRVDLGLQVAHRGGNSVSLFDRKRRTPSTVQALATFRWRVVDRHWGSLYWGVGLGGFVARQSPGFRASVAHQFEGPPHLAFTDERILGVSASSSAGLLLYDGDRLGFYAEVATNVAFADYRVNDQTVGYLLLDQGFQAGAIWSL